MAVDSRPCSTNRAGQRVFVRYERAPVCDVRSNCMTRTAHVKLSATEQDVKIRPRKELKEVSSEKVGTAMRKRLRLKRVGVDVDE